jgi:hypothetical protein
MRILLIVTLFLSNFLFANYNFKDENSGKIDMHGKNGSKLIDSSNSLGNTNFKVIAPIAPIVPQKPDELIKNEDKEIKNIENKDK